MRPRSSLHWEYKQPGLRGQWETVERGGFPPQPDFIIVPQGLIYHVRMRGDIQWRLFNTLLDAMRWAENPTVQSPLIDGQARQQAIAEAWLEIEQDGWDESW